VARRPLEGERICLDGGRRTTQLMRDSLGIQGPLCSNVFSFSSSQWFRQASSSLRLSFSQQTDEPVSCIFWVRFFLLASLGAPGNALLR
jgi:hypothetical protein